MCLPSQFEISSDSEKHNLITMDIESIYRISSVVLIVAAFVTAFAGGIQWWSGNRISNEQEAKVMAMGKDARIKSPAIFSQKVISQNIPEGTLFVHKYLVSINSPIVHIPLYTYIQYKPANGDIERVGGMQMNNVGGGVRRTEGENVSYVDAEYTVRTNRALADDETITFTLKERPNTVLSN